MKSIMDRIILTIYLALTVLIYHNGVNCQDKNATLTISTHDLLIVVQESERITFQLNGRIDQNVNITFQVQHDQVIQVIPNSFDFGPNSTETNQTAVIYGKSPGHVEITASVSPENAIDTSNIFVRVVVAVSSVLISISNVIGWCYFVAWSISFYPQMYTNFRRKSVVGLNFDFLSLNIAGFLLYSVFNAGLYFSSDIQAEYFERYPRGLNPVQLNDVFFAIHASFATSITIIQCFLYDRAEQRVSLFGRSLLSIFSIIVILFAILASTSTVKWLDFLYVCSYIKLCITLIKYVPQVIMNYRRKSTIGWSIGNILLDFTGGWLSMLQMMLNAYNYDDWASIFGDPTKFGLGLFSVMFDILFLLQHYVFYRNLEPYAEIDGDNNVEPTAENESAEVTS